MPLLPARIELEHFEATLAKDYISCYDGVISRYDSEQESVNSQAEHQAQSADFEQMADDLRTRGLHIPAAWAVGRAALHLNLIVPIRLAVRHQCQHPGYVTVRNLVSHIDDAVKHHRSKPPAGCKWHHLDDDWRTALQESDRASWAWVREEPFVPRLSLTRTTTCLNRLRLLVNAV